VHRGDIDDPEEISLPADIEVLEQNNRQFEILASWVVGFEGEESVLAIDNIHRMKASLRAPSRILNSFREH